MQLWQIEKFRNRVTNFDDFIRDLSNWLDNKKPSANNYGFFDGIGICFAYHNWCYYQNLDADLISRLKKDMYSSVYIILGTHYPFNNGEEKEYQRELDDDSIYRNPKRLDFIREAMEMING